MSIFNFQKIISASQSVFGYIGKAIPLYKQVVPTISDIRKGISSYQSIKNAAKEASFKEISSLERPRNVFKKKDNIYRSNNLDSLTLFSQKKN